MLIVHHLQRSQSERIVWLCEELDIPYELKVYARDSKTFLAPAEYKALHPAESAPIVQDVNGNDTVTLAESSAIVEYILTKYDPDNTLRPAPTSPQWPDYLYYFHFANGTLQPSVFQYGVVKRQEKADPSWQPDIAARFTIRTFEKSLAILEQRLSQTQWLAGPEFTAADVMVVFSLTTARVFLPYSLEGYDAVLAFLQRVAARPAYQRAMAKGEEGFEPLLSAEPNATVALS